MLVILAAGTGAPSRPPAPPLLERARFASRSASPGRGKVVALPGRGLGSRPSWAPRAPRPARAGLPNDPGAGKPVVQSAAGAPGRPSPPARSRSATGPPVNTPAGTSSRTRPPASVPSPAAHDRPHRPRTQQPPTRAAPVRPLLSRSHFATPPAHASCAPAASRTSPHPKHRAARTIDSDGRAQQDAAHKPHKEPVRARRTTQTARRTEPQPGRRKQRKREGATVAAPHAPQELRNARS